jgi:hypothetical protein
VADGAPLKTTQAGTVRCTPEHEGKPTSVHLTKVLYVLELIYNLRLQAGRA